MGGVVSHGCVCTAVGLGHTVGAHNVYCVPAVLLRCPHLAHQLFVTLLKRLRIKGCLNNMQSCTDKGNKNMTYYNICITHGSVGAPKQCDFRSSFWRASHLHGTLTGHRLISQFSVAMHPQLQTKLRVLYLFVLRIVMPMHCHLTAKPFAFHFLVPQLSTCIFSAQNAAPDARW